MTMRTITRRPLLTLVFAFLCIGAVPAWAQIHPPAPIMQACTTTTPPILPDTWTAVALISPSHLTNFEAPFSDLAATQVSYSWPTRQMWVSIYGTVTPDVETAVRNAKSGQVQFRTDRGGIVHGSVGQVGFSDTQVKENLEALVADLQKAKPAAAKGIFLKKITLSTTMGPGLAIDQASLEL